MGQHLNLTNLVEAHNCRIRSVDTDDKKGGNMCLIIVCVTLFLLISPCFELAS